MDTIINDIFKQTNSYNFSEYTLKYLYDVCDYLFRCDKDDIKLLNDRIRDLSVSYLFNGSNIDTFELIGCASIFADFLEVSIDNISETENLNLEYLIAQFNFSDITWSLSNIKNEVRSMSVRYEIFFHTFENR
jgi:hypothetical protein